MSADRGKHHLPAMTRRLTISESDDTESVLRLCGVHIMINYYWAFHILSNIWTSASRQHASHFLEYLYVAPPKQVFRRFSHQLEDSGSDGIHNPSNNWAWLAFAIISIHENFRLTCHFHWWIRTLLGPLEHMPIPTRKCSGILTQQTSK